MTQQEFEEIIKVIGNDSKYHHFVDRIKKDFTASKLKGIPVAMHAYFIEENEKNVGFCILSLSPLKMRQWEKTFKEEGWVEDDFRINISSFELMYLYVKPQFRRKGKAMALFNQVRKKAKTLGIKSIYAYVSDTNDAALKFYRQTGAKIIHDFSDEDDSLSAAYLMWEF